MNVGIGGVFLIGLVVGLIIGRDYGMSIRERRLYDPDARKRRKSSLVSVLSGLARTEPFETHINL